VGIAHAARNRPRRTRARSGPKATTSAKLAPLITFPPARAIVTGRNLTALIAAGSQILRVGVGLERRAWCRRNWFDPDHVGGVTSKDDRRHCPGLAFPAGASPRLSKAFNARPLSGRGRDARLRPQTTARPPRRHGGDARGEIFVRSLTSSILNHDWLDRPGGAARWLSYTLRRHPAGAFDRGVGALP
jgi:hypothetical protein